MSMRIVTPAGAAASVTVPAPGDPYSTPTTLPAGTVLDVVPSGAPESAIGLSNLTALTGAALATELDGSDGPATSNN